MLNQVLRAMLATALIFGVSNLAVAQYGGGMGGGMPGSPTYTPHGSYSNKAAWRVAETSSSMRRTIKPTVSATRRMRP